MTVHGATRHTSAALLLFPQHGHAKPPSDSVIMEIQQRSDYRVFRDHYFHCDEREVKEGLEFATAPSPFFKREEKHVNLEGEASGSHKRKGLEGEASDSDKKNSLEGEASGSDKTNSLEGEASGSDQKKIGNTPSCPGPPEASAAAPRMPAKNPGTSSEAAPQIPSAIPSAAKPYCSRNVSQLVKFLKSMTYPQMMVSKFLIYIFIGVYYVAFTCLTEAWRNHKRKQGKRERMHAATL